MKNIKLNINISNFSSTSGEINIPLELNLDPFYCNPEDVLTVLFNEDSDEWASNFELVVRTIFLGSRIFDKMLLSNSLDFPVGSTVFSSTAELYVLNYAIYWVGISCFKDTLKSISKSKDLGDFGISYKGDLNTTGIDSIILDSKKKMSEIESYLDEISSATQGAPAIFKYRLCGAKTLESQTRRWDYQIPEFGISYAGNKRILQDGKSYKTGAFYQYWMVGKIGYDNWGYDGQFTY